MQILIKPVPWPPGPKYDPRLLEKAIEGAWKDGVRLLRGYAKDYTQGWKHKVQFEADARVTNGNLIITLVPQPPNDQYWNWVSRGTGQAAGNRSDWYPIRPKVKKALAIAPYFPHTAGFERSASGGGPGARGEVTPRKAVTHPGIAPRHFEEGMAEKAEKWWAPMVQRAIKEARIFRRG